MGPRDLRFFERLAQEQHWSPPHDEGDGAWAFASLEARGDRRGPRIAIIKPKAACDQGISKTRLLGFSTYILR